MSAYIKSLQKCLEAEELPTPLFNMDLETRFLEWFDSLPEVSRYRAFGMVELEQALGTQGRHLSPVLLSLGWRRKRKWTGSGHYPRYWVPPAITDSPGSYLGKRRWH